MRRVYISGPMSGMPEHNFPAFNAEAARLRQLGYDVVNPVDVNPDPGTPWKMCLRADLREMLTCDTVALLPGWQISDGAHLELHVAHRVGIAIVDASSITERAVLPPVCWNCDTPVPPGCSGTFADDGQGCMLNRLKAAA
ncbi:DUF4406 domain-containing protein [Piscinibacter defluvii]|uniref:DUF4406 domain-containing protein n=1 Tax=Piscinibacter defluvii TaxID=1796922 RepID=UPI0013E32B4F|nr:DUF4406 domain-containing protein [Piscinibacter defluvii]